LGRRGTSQRLLKRGNRGGGVKDIKKIVARKGESRTEIVEKTNG